MATNRAMLKEAIADAKAVKETAIANAKAALEEAFTPQLKSMLSMKLQEMEDMDEAEDKETMEESDDKDMMEVDLEELLAELNEEDEVEESIFEAEEGEEDEESEESEEEGEPLDLEDMTDEDLKDMIEDVIADMIASGELEAGHEGGEAEEGDEMEMSDEEEEVDLAELLREIEEMEEEEVEEGLGSAVKSIFSPYKSFVEKFIKQNAGLAAKAKTGDEDAFRSLTTAFQNFMKEEGISGGARHNYIEPFNAMFGKKGESAYKDPQFSTPSGDAAVQEELAEAYSTIETLKNELNEINLLNAKLLYSNKIFKSKNLNESQKVKVLSSFDKAKTVGEVKMVFETLNEGIKVTKTTIKENLGSASKLTSAPTIKKPIVESNESFLRMQKLAGLI
jgi:hypothetical protein